jgi:hypothetical protein
MEINLKDELGAVRRYNAAVKVCAEANGDGSRALFERMIKDEERHADFLEAQLHAIKEMGIANYRSQAANNLPIILHCSAARQTVRATCAILVRSKRVDVVSLT